MNVILSVIFTFGMQQPVVVPSCCPFGTLVAVRVVPVVLVLAHPVNVSPPLPGQEDDKHI